jgi:hypothetical protein
MVSALLTTTTTKSATAATVAPEVPAVSSQHSISLPQAKANVHLFATMLRNGAPEPVAERVVMDLLREETGSSETARKDGKQRLIHVAECLARYFVPRPILREILTELEQQHGLLLGDKELEQLITAAITAAGEPDEPRRQPVPLALELHSPLDGWRRHVILGATGDDRYKTIRSLSGSLLARGVDPYVTAALVVAWAWMRCEPPVPAYEVLGIVNWVAKRHAEGVA